jgi:hypothetical protein
MIRGPLLTSNGDNIMLVAQHELLVSGPTADPNIYQATVLSSGGPFSMAIKATALGLD